MIGAGACRWKASEKDGKSVLGKTVSQLLAQEATRINRLTGSSAVWDLAGKTLGKPVYQLFGGSVPRQGVPVYDGSIYHEELLNRDQGSAYRNPNAPYGRKPGWSDILKEAIDISRRLGHTFVKVKIGRGALHLSRDAGNLQDAAVLRLIREHTGADFGIGVDANNGYRLEDTIWLLREHGDVNLAFIEEMFPDDVQNQRRLLHRLRRPRPRLRSQHQEARYARSQF